MTTTSPTSPPSPRTAYGIATLTGVLLGLVGGVVVLLSGLGLVGPGRVLYAGVTLLILSGVATWFLNLRDVRLGRRRS